MRIQIVYELQLNLDMKNLIFLLSVVLSSLAEAQQATHPRLVVLSLGEQKHPVILADELSKASKRTAEVERFRTVGLSQELRNEVAEMEKLGAISPFEESIFLMDSHPIWKTKYYLKKLDKLCVKSRNECMKDVFEKKSFTNVDGVVSYIRAHKSELYRKVDRILLDQQRHNKTKVDAKVGVFSQDVN